MKRFGILPVLLMVSLYADSEPLVVCASDSFAVSKLSRKEIVNIYLGKTRHLAGKKLLPINLPFDSEIRRRFEVLILKQSPERILYHQLQMHYFGHRAPKVVGSVKAVAGYLLKVDTALGYMQEDEAEKRGLKILYQGEE
jgi:hypothetical protein